MNRIGIIAVLIAVASIQQSSEAQVLQGDLFLDYDVYAGLESSVTAFFVEIIFDDGSTDEWGPYWSYRNAQHAIFRAVNHGQNANWRTVRIASRQIQDPMRFFRIFGRLSEAQILERALIHAGYRVEIRPVYAPPKLPDGFRDDFGNRLRRQGF